MALALGGTGRRSGGFGDWQSQQNTPAPGYTYDPNTGRQIPLPGSPTDVLGQRTRQQGLEDEARSRTLAGQTSDRNRQDALLKRTQNFEDADRNARDTLRDRLMGMLDRPTETSSYSGNAWGGGGGGGAIVPFDPTPYLQGAGQAPPMPTFDPSQFASMMTSSQGPALPAQIGSVALPDTSAAQANLFARAKDKVGLQTQGSLASLRSALAGRGMLGGGAEVRGAQNILQSGQGQLGDVTREQAIQEANRQTDFAKMGYEGAIAQRGQDITARGQNIGAQESARDAALRAAQIGYEGQIAGRGQTLNAQESARDAALRAGLAGYEGQITQRGQDLTARGQDISAWQAAADRASAGNRTRYDSVTGLLGKLY